MISKSRTAPWAGWALALLGDGRTEPAILPSRLRTGGPKISTSNIAAMTRTFNKGEPGADRPAHLETAVPTLRADGAGGRFPFTLRLRKAWGDPDYGHANLMAIEANQSWQYSDGRSEVTA